MIVACRRREDFERLRRARPVRGRYLWMRSVPDEHLPEEQLPEEQRLECRVAYAIGRSVGSAVTRNRLRRRLRALVAAAEAAGRLPAGAHLIGVGSGADVGTASYAELTADIDRILPPAGGQR